MQEFCFVFNVHLLYGIDYFQVPVLLLKPQLPTSQEITQSSHPSTVEDGLNVMNDNVAKIPHSF